MPAECRPLLDADAAARAWIAVQTHVRKEQVALDNLHRQDFSTYCPRVLRTVRRGRSASSVCGPMFPSYIFVQIDFEAQRWRPILSTLGVRSVVRIGDRPGTVPAGFVEALRSREIDGSVAIQREPLHCGQRVRVEGGALQGLIGTIIEMDEKERIVVLMELLNQQVRVKVDRAQVAAARAG